MAEALLKEKTTRFDVKSAGVHAFSGSPASEGTRRVLEERGIKTEHKAQLVTEELLDWADLVLTMTGGHRDLVISNFPEFEEKVYTLKGYVQSEDGAPDIADPIGGPLKAYKHTAQEIEQCIERLIER